MPKENHRYHVCVCQRKHRNEALQIANSVTQQQWLWIQSHDKGAHHFKLQCLAVSTKLLPNKPLLLPYCFTPIVKGCHCWSGNEILWFKTENAINGRTLEWWLRLHRVVSPRILTPLDLSQKPASLTQWPIIQHNSTSYTPGHLFQSGKLCLNQLTLPLSAPSTWITIEKRVNI